MPVISYADFCQQALYGPGGYYTGHRPRVGRRAESDFYTSSSVPLFSRLLSAAFETLRELNRLKKPTLIEIGNEPSAPLFGQTPENFGTVKNYPLGKLEKITDNEAIVFSNELFDAQPFERVRTEEPGSWQQLGLNPQEKILDVKMQRTSELAQKLLGKHFAPGATVDVSFEACDLAGKICEGNWKGVFVAFDYGLSLAELMENPRPTARAYKEHRQLSLEEALNLPMGTYDITHHVVWDSLAQVLTEKGFHVHPISTQESFFVNYAAHIFPSLQENERRQLATLLHPAHMGAKFQVMVAVR